MTFQKNRRCINSTNQPSPSIRVGIVGLFLFTFNFDVCLNFKRTFTFFLLKPFFVFACVIQRELFWGGSSIPREPSCTSSMDSLPSFLLLRITRSGGVWIGWVCPPPILPAFFINGTVLNSMLGFFSADIALAPPTDGRSILIQVLTSSSISTPSTSIEPPSPSLGIVIPLVS